MHVLTWCKRYGKCTCLRRWSRWLSKDGDRIGRQDWGHWERHGNQIVCRRLCYNSGIGITGVRERRCGGTSAGSCHREVRREAPEGTVVISGEGCWAINHEGLRNHNCNFKKTSNIKITLLFVSICTIHKYFSYSFIRANNKWGKQQPTAPYCIWIRKKEVI